MIKIKILLLFLLTLLLACSCTPSVQLITVTKNLITTTTETETQKTTVTTTAVSIEQPEYSITTFVIGNSEQEPLETLLTRIYLRNNQTLHLTWTVIEKTSILLWITTPLGMELGYHYNGDFANGSLKENFANEASSGVIIFSPSDYNWGEGYYELLASTPPTIKTIELRYWIEEY